MPAYSCHLNPLWQRDLFLVLLCKLLADCCYVCLSDFLAAANLIWHWIPWRIFLNVELAVAHDFIFGDQQLVLGTGERRRDYPQEEEEDMHMYNDAPVSLALAIDPFFFVLMLIDICSLSYLCDCAHI